MTKLGFLLLALLAPTGAAAGEVGAPIPQIANSPALLAVAIAETGAVTRLTPAVEARKIKHRATPVSADALQRYAEQSLAGVNEQTKQRIAEQLQLQRAF